MTTTADITCREIVELVSDYIEDALPPQERARFEMHLVYCRGCDVYVEQMRETLRLMGRLSEDSLDEPVKQSLLAAFRDWKRGTGGR